MASLRTLTLLDWRLLARGAWLVSMSITVYSASWLQEQSARNGLRK